MPSQRANRESEDLGLRALEEARLDLVRGIGEEGGHNLGPAIAAYGKPFGLRPPINWCAVAVAAWIRRAAKSLGIDPPVGSPGAQATMGQFRSLGLWTKATQIFLDERALRPGNILVWWRNPEPTWMGHIGIIEDVVLEGARTIAETIEGNSGPKGDRVARMERDLTDPRLLGVGRLRSDDKPPDTLTSADLTEAHRLMSLSHEVASFHGRDPMDIVQELIDQAKTRG